MLNFKLAISKSKCLPSKLLQTCNQHRKIKRFFFAVLFFASILLFMATFRQEITDVSHLVHTSYCLKNAKTIQHRSKERLVLFYTPWFGRTQWPWNMSQDDGRPCFHNCVITYNKCDLARSDAVIFHAVDIPSARALRWIASWHRNDRQRWVYLSHENPYNVGHETVPYNGIFNWTVTYRRDSDVFYPGGYFRAIHSPDEIPKDHFSTNYAKGKDKLIAWAVSHCGRLRDKVVQKLTKFVQVTVFGACSRVFNQNVNQNKCKSGSKECSSLLKTFKFYLAFENEMCFDYITEKYWETPFDNNMVPIVLGFNYDSKVVIPGSYINIQDFPSMEAFANYIKYLDKNDTAYNEYFQWKTKYKRWDGDSLACRVCANLHNETLPKKVYDNFGEYWGIQSNCDRHYNANIKRLIV